mmetsp:Transcript_9064/g.37390  ORF Transcript_9064/g.37390 Transcript_9064/m.37390 type:complete len:263 (-) Transcript_9064:355-1143(-)
MRWCSREVASSSERRMSAFCRSRAEISASIIRSRSPASAWLMGWSRARAPSARRRAASSWSFLRHSSMSIPSRNAQSTSSIVPGWCRSTHSTESSVTVPPSASTTSFALAICASGTAARACVACLALASTRSLRDTLSASLAPLPPSARDSSGAAMSMSEAYAAGATLSLPTSLSSLSTLSSLFSLFSAFAPLSSLSFGALAERSSALALARRPVHFCWSFSVSAMILHRPSYTSSRSTSSCSSPSTEAVVTHSASSVCMRR